MASLEFMEHIKKVMQDGLFHDIKIVFTYEDQPDYKFKDVEGKSVPLKTYSLHKFVLSRADYFLKLFTGTFSDSSTSEMVIPVLTEVITEDILDEFIHILYTYGNIIVTKKMLEHSLSLHSLCCRFLFKEGAKIFEEAIISNINSLNVLDICEYASSRDCTTIILFCKQFIKAFGYKEKLFDPQKLQYIDRKTVLDILSSNDLILGSVQKNRLLNIMFKNEDSGLSVFSPVKSSNTIHEETVTGIYTEDLFTNIAPDKLIMLGTFTSTHHNNIELEWKVGVFAKEVNNKSRSISISIKGINSTTPYITIDLTLDIYIIYKGFTEHIATNHILNADFCRFNSDDVFTIESDSSNSKSWYKRNEMGLATDIMIPIVIKINYAINMPAKANKKQKKK